MSLRVALSSAPGQIVTKAIKLAQDLSQVSADVKAQIPPPGQSTRLAPSDDRPRQHLEEALTEIAEKLDTFHEEAQAIQGLAQALVALGTSSVSASSANASAVNPSFCNPAIEHRPRRVRPSEREQQIRSQDSETADKASSLGPSNINASAIDEATVENSDRHAATPKAQGLGNEGSRVEGDEGVQLPASRATSRHQRAKTASSPTKTKMILKNRTSLPSRATASTSEAQHEDSILLERFVVSSADLPPLEPGQLGERMPETLYRLSQTPGYMNKARLPWIVERTSSMNMKEVLIPRGDPDVQFNTLTPRRDGGVNVCRHDPEEGKAFEWPDFKKRIEPITTVEALQELKSFLEAKSRDVSYFCGLMDSALWHDCPLYAGEQLAGIKELTHANQIYTHLGMKGSATAMHKEDDRLRSVNVGLVGTKLWLLIDAEETDNFEKWVRSGWDCKRCPQFIRHLNIFFGPKQLEAAGIRFSIDIQHAGDLMETKQHQYHQVLNIEDSLAISINYLAPSETPMFLDAGHPLEVCSECGFKGLHGRKGFHVRCVDTDVPAPGPIDPIASVEERRRPTEKRGKKRRAPKDPVNMTRRVTRACVERTADSLQDSQASITPSELSSMIQAEAPNFKISQRINADVDVLKMVAWIVQPLATEQVVSLVQAWRARKTTRVVPNNAKDPLAEYAIYLKDAVEKTELSKFQLRYARACTAWEVDKANNQRYRMKLPTDEFESLAQRLDMTRAELKGHLEEGRAWNRLCGPFDGLLPFVFLGANEPLQTPMREWRRLEDKKLEKLHYYLKQLSEHVEQRCRAGRVVQDIILRGSSAVFGWERNATPLAVVKDVALLGEVEEPMLS